MLRISYVYAKYTKNKIYLNIQGSTTQFLRRRAHLTLIYPTTEFLVRRVPSATLGKNSDDGIVVRPTAHHRYFLLGDAIDPLSQEIIFWSYKMPYTSHAPSSGAYS